MKKLFVALTLFTGAACTSLTTLELPQIEATEALPLAISKPANPSSPLDTQPLPSAALQESQALIVYQPDSGEILLHRVDPRNGQDATKTLPLHLGDSDSGSILSSLSTDGKRLALTSGTGESCEPYSGGSYCMGSQDTLTLVDLPKWQPNEIELPGAGWTSALAFNPDGSRLALAYHQPEGDRLLTFDTHRGAQLTNRELPFTPQWMDFALDGSALALVGSQPGENPGMSQPGELQLLLLDSDSLEIRWQLDLAGVLSGEWCLENCAGSYEEIRFAYYQPAILLSADSTKIFVIHAGEEKFTRLDLKEQLSRTIDIQAVGSWLERLLSWTATRAQAKTMPVGQIRKGVLSPNGSMLFIATQNMFAESPEDNPMITLQGVDLERGRVIAEAESMELNYTQGLFLAPGGDELLLVGWDQNSPRSEIYDLNLSRLGFLDGWQVSQSSDTLGTPRLLGSNQGDGRTVLGAVEPENFEIYDAWVQGGLAWWPVSNSH